MHRGHAGLALGRVLVLRRPDDVPEAAQHMRGGQDREKNIDELRNALGPRRALSVPLSVGARGETKTTLPQEMTPHPPTHPPTHSPTHTTHPPTHQPWMRPHSAHAQENGSPRHLVDMKVCLQLLHRPLQPIHPRHPH